MRSGHITVETVMRCVGQQIAVLRRRANLEQETLGKETGYSGVHVSAMERGKRLPQPKFLEGADAVLGAGGILAAVVDLVEEARATSADGWGGEPATFSGWHAYAPTVVPPVFRTEDYARAVLRASRPLMTEEEVEKTVAAQASARELLEHDPLPLVTCVLEEAVLLRPYGGREVLRGQLAHLADLARRRHVEIQVMSTGVEEHPAPTDAFVLLEPQRPRPAVARTGGRLITRRTDVRPLEDCYGALRARALPPAESLELIERIRTAGEALPS
ncbi:MAG TPA: helix-turn-helix transcriptional regulator [Streptomyces sp.]|nr:helix-turn-helix transcriptional regulator [Streptomyces sp.]